MCCTLTSDPAKHAIPKTAEAAYSISVGELGWQCGAGLKSHGTVTNWCIGREWPVNCMTFISARWRWNMPFKRRRKCICRWPVMGRDWVEVELLYNSVHMKFNEFWGSDELEIRCGRENQHPERLGPQAHGWAVQENGKDTWLWPIEWGSIFCSLCLVSLSHTTFSNKVRGIFF